MKWVDTYMYINYAKDKMVSQKQELITISPGLLGLFTSRAKEPALITARHTPLPQDSTRPL